MNNRSNSKSSGEGSETDSDSRATSDYWSEHPGVLSFGDLMKRWRKRSQLSQVALANESGTSQRHISFLERGRAMPTRALLIQICRVLMLSSMESNLLFEAAGFAALYRKSDLDRLQYVPDRQAVREIMINHHPLPAVLLNHYMDVVSMNDSAGALFSLISGGTSDCFSGELNLVEVLCRKGGPRCSIENWSSLLMTSRAPLHARTLMTTADERAANMVKLIDETLEYQHIYGYQIPDSRTPPYVEVVIDHSMHSARWYVALLPLRLNHESSLDSWKLLLWLPLDRAGIEFAATQ